MTYKPGLKTLKAEVVSSDLGRVLNVCPEIDTNLFPTYHVAIYYYSTPIAHEEPVREEFTRTGSSFMGARQAADNHWLEHWARSAHDGPSLLLTRTDDISASTTCSMLTKIAPARTAAGRRRAVLTSRIQTDAARPQSVSLARVTSSSASE